MKIAKIIGYSLVVVVVLFIVAIASVAYIFRNFGQPSILYSDSTPEKWDADERKYMVHWAESEIDHVFAGISIEEVTDLYFGGGAFCQMLVSFRMDSQEEIELLLRKRGLEIQGLQKGKFSSDGPWKHYHLPHEWDKRYQDSNWPLKVGDDFLYHGDGDELIFYTPEDNRIYVMINHFS